MNINTSNELHRVLKKVEGEVEKMFHKAQEREDRVEVTDVLDIINNNKPI